VRDSKAWLLMSPEGHKRRWKLVHVMSALLPKADIAEWYWDVRSVPKADVLLRRFRMPQGRVELVKRPIYIVAGDHQRGTDTDGVVMGVLTQDATQT